MLRYLYRILTLFSHALNVIVLFGEPDESVSGRSYREGVLKGNKKWLRLAKVVDFVFFWEPDHCWVSHSRDVKYAKRIIKMGRVKWLKTLD